MQQKILHKKILTLKSVDETEYTSIVFERLQKLKSFEALRKEGGSIATICSALNVPQSTLYRWKKNYEDYGLSGLENSNRKPHNLRKPTWSTSLTKIILKVRRENPLYGKYKVTAIIKRDYDMSASVSMVGRIICYFIRKDQVKPASFYVRGRYTQPRIFNTHAKRLTIDMHPKQPGDLVQIDHMSVSPLEGFGVKHFQAVCPISKITVKQAYSCATSNIAKEFLRFATTQFPFDISSLQVDGGSEFRGEFELECQNLSIPLYVTPPRTPERNGTVERANGSSKYEFYYFYQGPKNITSLRLQLQRYVHKYNTFRPHQALQYLTPQQYYQNWQANHSHM